MSAAVLNLHLMGTVLLLWTIAPLFALAQPPATQEQDEMPRVGAVQQREPDLYYLKSENGELVPVPNLSLEEWQELKLLEKGLVQRDVEPDRFNFVDDIQIDGKVEQQHLDLEVTFKVRLAESSPEGSTNWVRIPLGMSRAKLSPGTEHDGPGKSLIAYDRNGDGYILWLKAPADSVHDLKLRMKTALGKRGSESSLLITTPPHPTRFRLDVLGTGLEVLSNDDGKAILNHRPADRGRTMIEVENVGGRLEISWRVRRQVTLEANATVRTLITKRRIEAEAAISVRTFLRPAKWIDIRLPVGMRFFAGGQQGLDVEITENDPTTGQVVRITRSDGKAASAFDVQLKAMTPASEDGPRGEFELGGFDVISAARQQGVVDLAVNGEWQVDWTLGPGIRQAIPLRDTTRQETSLATFEYDAQPYSLKVEVTPKQSRVIVEPLYRVFVEPTRLRLEAILNYRVTGSRVRNVQVDFSGWDVQNVSSPEIEETVSTGELSPLKIPLRTSLQSPLPEDFEIRVEAYQPLDENATRLRAVLPRALENAATPATVVIIPNDNVELTPLRDDITGLVAEVASPELELPERQQTCLVYREEQLSPSSVFISDLELREGSISVQVQSELSFTEAAVAVEQRLSYEIAFEPTNEIILDAPAALAALDGIQFLIGDEPIQIKSVSQAVGDSDPDRVWMTIDLLRDRIGTCEILARYEDQLGELQANEAQELTLDLVKPLEDDALVITQNRMHVQSANTIEVEITDANWQPVVTETSSAAKNGRTFQTDQQGRDATFWVTLIQSPRQTSTLLTRAWLQTWLSQAERQDRASFLVTTNEDRLRFVIPDGATLQAVALDGKRAPSSLSVELERSTETQEHTIELWYSLPHSRSAFTSVSIEPPMILGVDSANRAYWQLIMPRTEHLLWSSQQLTAEFTWLWGVTHMGRRPNREQWDLELLVNGTHQDPIPSQTNRYLFSSVGSITPVYFKSASRMMILALLSAGVLIVGLAMIYVRALRHPAALLVGGVSVLTVGVAMPEPAILAAQAASLGIGLVLVAYLLRWNVVRRQPQVPPYPAASLIPGDSRSKEISVDISSSGSQAATTVSPGPVPIPMVEPKP